MLADSPLSFLVLAADFLVLLLLVAYGLHRCWIVFLYWRHHKSAVPLPRPAMPADWRPLVTVQLPVFNERFVVERLIDSVCALDYPREALEIQVLDDSTDDTVALVSQRVAHWNSLGARIRHLRRGNRDGFKAGALAAGLKEARGEFVAIFDADFVPPPDFLNATLPRFLDGSVGLVQTRWGHLNADYSLLTRLQALFLDGHFLLEHTARHRSGAFFNFNGTAGIWRRTAIESSGGWSARTLTEDLDLSYRAQLAGWRFVYDPDFVCPAELPLDIHGFRSQQARWTQGALQVARLLLGDVWRAKLPLHAKIEATVHLTGNLGYPLTVLACVLLLPTMFLRTPGPSLAWGELGLFTATTASISFFYAVSQRDLYSDWRRRILDLPALMSFGIGMCLANARAVLSGLAGRPADFVRTPKHGIRGRWDPVSLDAYDGQRASAAPQIFFAAYALLTVVFAMARQEWAALPFGLLFLFGFAYVARLSLSPSVRN